MKNRFLSEAKIIGGGGFGTVYLQPDGTVLKAIVSKKACGDASIELNKQRRVYEVFEKLKDVEFKDPLFNLIKNNVIVSKPIRAIEDPIIIGGKVFACYFSMTRLHGIPLSIYNEINPEILDKFTSQFLKERGKEFEIMLQLSFNSELPSKIYGINYSKAQINSKNPPRGFFINEKAVFIDGLRQKYGLILSNENLKEIIGFIYGIIFFQAGLIPMDIEITLGMYEDGLKINVLDFGMTIDLENPDEMPVVPRTQQIAEIFNNSSLSKEEKLDKIIRRTLIDISTDLYCDLDPESQFSDKYCINGWEVASIIQL